MSERPDETDARAYVETGARHLIDELADLEAIVGAVYAGTQALDEMGVRRVREALDRDVGDMTPGELSTAAEDRLIEMPLAVEATTTWEIVLGTGGPDRRLLFECSPFERIDSHSPTGFSPGGYEVRRILYRYSWDGSAEIELVGSDREVAEAFGRRVVPELA